MGGRSSMQGTAWHYVNRWELKSKDEFEWETKERKTRKKKKKKKKNETNYVELSRKNMPVQKRSFKGNFTLKFEGEDEEDFVIGKNIKRDAEIVKKVYYSEAGKIITINDEKALIVCKNMR